MKILNTYAERKNLNWMEEKILKKISILKNIYLFKIKEIFFWFNSYKVLDYFRMVTYTIIFFSFSLDIHSFIPLFFFLPHFSFLFFFSNISVRRFFQLVDVLFFFFVSLVLFLLLHLIFIPSLGFLREEEHRIDERRSTYCKWWWQSEARQKKDI